jgi:hypothetical protein
MSSILTAEELYNQTHSNVIREYYLVYIYSYIVFTLLVMLYFLLFPTHKPYMIITYILLILTFLIGFPRII